MGYPMASLAMVEYRINRGPPGRSSPFRKNRQSRIMSPASRSNQDEPFASKKSLRGSEDVSVVRLLEKVDESATVGNRDIIEAPATD